jgi:hypothetical protein
LHIPSEWLCKPIAVEFRLSGHRFQKLYHVRPKQKGSSPHERSDMRDGKERRPRISLRSSGLRLLRINEIAALRWRGEIFSLMKRAISLELHVSVISRNE